MARRRQPVGDRGFALLVVLWWAVLLALIGSQVVSSGRLEAARAGNLRDAAIARAAADGALQEAVLHVVDGSLDRWAADGAMHEIVWRGGVARVRIRNEAAKLGLNVASAAEIAALLVRLGVAPHEAARLADAILDWRTATQKPRPLGAKAADYQTAAAPVAPPEEDFETLDELGLVRGMTPALMARLAPYVSVYQPGEPDAALADPLIQLAQHDAGGPLVSSDRTGLVAPPPVVDISVVVELATGGRAARHSIIRLAADSVGRPYQVLDSY